MAVDGDYAALFVEFIKHDCSGSFWVFRSRGRLSSKCMLQIGSGDFDQAFGPRFRICNRSFIVTPIVGACDTELQRDGLNLFRTGSRNQNPDGDSREKSRTPAYRGMSPLDLGARAASADSAEGYGQSSFAQVVGGFRQSLGYDFTHRFVHRFSRKPYRVCGGCPHRSLRITLAYWRASESDRSRFAPKPPSSRGRAPFVLE